MGINRCPAQDVIRFGARTGVGFSAGVVGGGVGAAVGTGSYEGVAPVCATAAVGTATVIAIATALKVGEIRTNR